MPLAESELATRCASIELLVVDVDGVMTDGVIAIDDNDVETKHFHVRDGTAFHLWSKAGKRSAILSGRRAACVDIRAAELGITPVIQGSPAKTAPFQAMIRDLGIDAQQVCYVGDDLADLPVLSAVGLAACPADAVPEVRTIAHFVAPSVGGRGAIRDVVELLLKHKNAWERLVDTYRIPA
jgi:3-deoxy-D-manno-octulosonate 8-phosphate phosphatase (KDO 8-P phosphatase)